MTTKLVVNIFYFQFFHILKQIFKIINKVSCFCINIHRSCRYEVIQTSTEPTKLQRVKFVSTLSIFDFFPQNILDAYIQFWNDVFMNKNSSNISRTCIEVLLSAHYCSIYHPIMKFQICASYRMGRVKNKMDLFLSANLSEFLDFYFFIVKI